MRLVPGSERIIAESESNPVDGVVRWSPAKSLWIGGMSSAAVHGVRHLAPLPACDAVISDAIAVFL